MIATCIGLVVWTVLLTYWTHKHDKRQVLQARELLNTEAVAGKQDEDN